MKGENYLYFQNNAAEASATNECIMIPASRVLGMTVGSQYFPTRGFLLTYQSLSNTGTAKGYVLIYCANKTPVQVAEAMDDVIAAINSTPDDGFVTIIDVLNNVYCSKHITSAFIASV